MSESLPLRREGEPSPPSSIDTMDEDMAEGMAYKAGPKAIRGARDLTTGPLFTTLLLFTLPTLASNILWSLNGSISSLWVAHFLGDAALAATATANMIMFLMFSVIFGFGMAANVLVGQAFGRGDLTAARTAFGGAAGFCLLSTIVIAFAGFMWSEPILAMLSTPPEVFRLAKLYLHYTFFGLPAAMMFIMVMSGLRGGGDAMTPLWFIIMTLILGTALNPIFILGIGPAPQMGIAGSAFANAIASYVSLAAMIGYIYKRDLPLRLRGAEFRYLKPNRDLMKIILGRGLPMGIQMVVMSLSTLVIIGFVNREGTMTAAAFAAALLLWNYLQMPAMAIGGAVTATAAQNIGAEKWDRVDRTTYIGMGIAMAITGALIGLLTLFERQILSLFLEGGGEAIEIGVHMMDIVNWSYFIFGVTMMMFATMRANGIVLAPLIILTLSLFFVRIGFYYLSYPIIGIEGLWWSFTVSSAVALVLAWLYYRFGKWRSVRLVVPAKLGRKVA